MLSVTNCLSCGLVLRCCRFWVRRYKFSKPSAQFTKVFSLGSSKPAKITFDCDDWKFLRVENHAFSILSLSFKLLIALSQKFRIKKKLAKPTLFYLRLQLTCNLNDNFRKGRITNCLYCLQVSSLCLVWCRRCRFLKLACSLTDKSLPSRT